MNRVAALLLLLFVAPRHASGQPGPSPDFFPLDVGNWWVQAYVETHVSPPVTITTARHEVLEEVDIEGRSYYRLSSHLVDADLVRSDTLGRIWGIRRGEEQLLLDFTAPDDGTYLYKLDDEYSYVVQVRRDLTVQTLAGSFSSCVSVNFDVPEMVDDEIGYVFAPGIGLISIAGAWEFGTLLAANVGDTSIITASVHEDVPRGHGLSMAVYPIPATSRAELEIEATAPERLTVSIYDLLGRRLAIDEWMVVSPGRNRRALDLSEFASGVYLFRIRHENGQTRTLIVPRQ